MALKPVVLIIRDGWGIGAPGPYNAVANAATPCNDRCLAVYPHSILETSGVAVGLPAGYQGSSEVGHLNIGAGRIVKQELARINDALQDGRFFQNANYQSAMEQCVTRGTSLHLMGLVQDEGVHAHQEHLFAILKNAKERDVRNVWIHFFTDGRDTAPRSALSYLFELKHRMTSSGVGRIATLMGRYYAMDRGRNWNLTDCAYDAIVSCAGSKAPTAEEAIQRSYTDDKTPNGEAMFDEYIRPFVIDDYAGVQDGDSVIHFNYRQDRAIQLTQAFIDADYPGKRQRHAKVAYAGLTKYYDAFQFNVLDAMGDEGGMENLLGEVLSKAGRRQLRISETQKFRHVTSFFNGKKISPFIGEDRIEIPGSFDPSMFAEHPEMNAREITNILLPKIAERAYDFILINYPNCDMVGHTGNYDAARKAVEVTDECVSRVVDATLAVGGGVLVTADHGNAEEMFDVRSGLPKTSHTLNPVEIVLVAERHGQYHLRGRGILADIAPTVLGLMGIAQPAEMTGHSLIEHG